MERRKFTREFKLEAVRLIKQRGVSYVARHAGGGCVVWTASDRAVDAAPGSQSPSNVLNRSFEAPAPNRKWIADFTYVWTAEGWLYVAAVIDLFSRRAVGWSMVLR